MINDLYVSEVIIRTIFIDTITDNHFITVLFKLFVNYSMYIYLLHFVKQFDTSSIIDYNKQVTGL